MSADKPAPVYREVKRPGRFCEPFMNAVDTDGAVSVRPFCPLCGVELKSMRCPRCLTTYAAPSAPVPGESAEG
jgi:hypothetical protein